MYEKEKKIRRIWFAINRKKILILHKKFADLIISSIFRVQIHIFSLKIYVFSLKIYICRLKMELGAGL